MECCANVLWYFMVGVLLLVPILWQLSGAFRFVVKIMGIYLCVFITAFVGFFYILPTAYDPNNHKKILWIFKSLTGWADIKWEVRGAHNLDIDTACVVMGNHQSSLDLQGFCYFWPDRGVCMIKKSLQYAGLLGLSAKLCQGVFIDRFNPADARDTMDTTMQRVKDNKLKLYLFPEGTRNHEDGLLPFKKGGFHLAVQAQIPIVPVVYSSYKPFYSKNEWKWIPGGHAICEVLAPIPTAGLVAADVGQLAIDTRLKMLLVHERISKEAAALCKPATN